MDRRSTNSTKRHAPLFLDMSSTVIMNNDNINLLRMKRAKRRKASDDLFTVDNPSINVSIAIKKIAKQS